ncbi:hypothetical protein MHI43_13970 [Paenibacillus sp. FSL H8-0457]|uniref:hypothetical protein n=1 Tax=Bacillales TaxID=1385 RepID=UPI0001787F9B|nr:MULTISPECIES: hypothetical protein [Paenibacillus]ACX64980.1 conserved hypothetical protein [Paenibacillus sp. Y412MC10]ETT62351.1 hypothetical protein C172_18006 [Paenibacillus sp. FSL H8-457]MCM3257477.1 hypothetical protein [Paenibacillus lautus]
MLNIALIAVSAAIITWLELPRMLREKEYREVWGFAAFMIIAIGISVAQTILRDIPTPLVMITIAFKPLSDWLTAIGLIQ